MPETAGCWFVRKPKNCKAILEHVDLVSPNGYFRCNRQSDRVSDRVTNFEKCLGDSIKGSLIVFHIRGGTEKPKSVSDQIRASQFFCGASKI